MAGNRSPKLTLMLVATSMAATIWFGISAAPTLADGTVDPTFSTDGRVVTDLDAGSDDEALAATVDAQGRLVLAGYSFKSPDGIRLAVARYLPDGLLDASFGGDGIVLDNHGGGIFARDVAIDSAGRIVVAGQNARQEPHAIRLLDDGRIDDAFGRRGVAHVPFEFDIRALTRDQRGRILLAGAARTFAQLDFGAIRLLDDGSLDRSFDEDGLAMHSLWPNGPESAADVFIDGFDRIVLAGATWVPHGNRNIGRFALARLHDDGRLDESLRGGGTALITMNKRGAFATSAALVGAGTTILAGRAAPHTGFAKVGGAGELRQGFGRGGRAKLATTGAQWAMDVAVDGSGRPVAAIGAPKLSLKGAGALVAARLRPNGRPDLSFSADGRALARFGRWTATATSLALQQSGAIVVAGAGRRSGANHSDFVAARFRGSGG